MASSLRYIGLMSGTSMDAVDAVLLSIDPDAETPYRIQGHHSCPLPGPLRQDLHLLSQPGRDHIDLLGITDVAVGRLFANTALEMLAALGVDAGTITAIGSHGQTVRHRPRGADWSSPFTLQIGDPSTIAALTGITTVADFRRKDMALGGEGAPLAPAFHQAVFRSPLRNRAVVNIGGIANITWLPATSTGDGIAGFDTGPGNCLMDEWVSRHRGQPYDGNGHWASTGAAVPELLEALLAEPYLAVKPPKSTGREHFNLAWLDRILSKMSSPLPPAHVQATLCEFTATTIAAGLKAIAGDQAIDDIYICGGGAFNGELMTRLRQTLPHISIQTTAVAGIHPLQVEGAAFAWLAHQTLNRLPGNVSDVTGARRAAVLGGIYLP